MERDCNFTPRREASQYLSLNPWVFVHHSLLGVMYTSFSSEASTNAAEPSTLSYNIG